MSRCASGGHLADSAQRWLDCQRFRAAPAAQDILKQGGDAALAGKGNQPTAEAGGIARRSRSDEANRLPAVALPLRHLGDGETKRRCR